MAKFLILSVLPKLKIIMIKKIALLNLLIGTMVLIGACSQGESNVDVGNREQILHIGNGTEPQGLDPHVVTGVPEHHIISASVSYTHLTLPTKA